MESAEYESIDEHCLSAVCAWHGWTNQRTATDVSKMRLFGYKRCIHSTWTHNHFRTLSSNALWHFIRVFRFFFSLRWSSQRWHSELLVPGKCSKIDFISMFANIVAVYARSFEQRTRTNGEKKQQFPDSRTFAHTWVYCMSTLLYKLPSRLAAASLYFCFSLLSRNSIKNLLDNRWHRSKRQQQLWSRSGNRAKITLLTTFQFYIQTYLKCNTIVRDVLSLRVAIAGVVGVVVVIC